MVLLDTCAVLELFRVKPALSAGCRKKIDAGASVLSVSFAEICLKVKLGELVIDAAPQRLYEEMAMVPSVSIVDIGCRDWFDSVELPWKHRDPADRLIVAFALRHGYPIVTTDRQIKEYYPKVIW